MVEELVEDADFSDAFCHFVQSSLPTFEAVELLVELYRNPDTALPQDPRAAKHLGVLRAAGLLDEALRYAPASEELRRHVATLATAYDERPVTLVRLIYALRDDKIRSFADAFRLRKD